VHLRTYKSKVRTVHPCKPDTASDIRVAYEERMKKGILALTKRTETHIKDAIEKTLKSWSLGSIEDDAVDGVIGRGPEPAKAMDKRSVKVLVVKSIAHAEEFLRLSQRELQTSLNREKQDFVTAIRRMAEEARGKRFQELKDEFARLDPLIQAELREEIIEDLNNQSVDVRQVVFNHIKNEARVETRDSNVRLTSPQIKTTKTRHTAATAFRAIEERLAKPLLSQKEEAVKVVDEAEQKALKTIDDLGFVRVSTISVHLLTAWLRCSAPQFAPWRLFHSCLGSQSGTFPFSSFFCLTYGKRADPPLQAVDDLFPIVSPQDEYNRISVSGRNRHSMAADSPGGKLEVSLWDHRSKLLSSPGSGPHGDLSRRRTVRTRERA